MRLKKLEPSNVQGVCVVCNMNPQRSKGKGLFKPICRSCERKRHPSSAEAKRRKRLKDRGNYARHKKETCEACGFIPAHPCQLDIDHIDGNHSNNDISNLQTLCANCHRLKTYENKDWFKKTL